MLYLQAGAEYTLKFDMSANPDQGSTKVMEVSVDGVTTTYTYDPTSKGNTRGDMKWEEMVYTFTASSSATQITFSGDSGFTAWGPALDNVRVYTNCDDDDDDGPTGEVVGDPRKYQGHGEGQLASYII